MLHDGVLGLEHGAVFAGMAILRTNRVSSELVRQTFWSRSLGSAVGVPTTSNRSRATRAAAARLKRGASARDGMRRLRLL